MGIRVEEFEKDRIYWISVEDLIPLRNEKNPPDRAKSKITELAKSMSRDGWPVGSHLTIGSDGILSDGHRRLEGAIEAGIDRVPVIFSDRPSSELMVLLNSNGRPFSSVDWAHMYLKKAATKAQLPPRLRNAVEEGGERIAWDIANGKVGVETVNSASAILKKLEKAGKISPEVKQNHTGGFIRWVESNGMSNWLSAARDDTKTNLGEELFETYLRCGEGKKRLYINTRIEVRAKKDS